MIRNLCKNLLISASFFIIFFECGSRITLFFNLIPDIYKRYGLDKPEHFKYHGMNWRNEIKSWGAWHKENTEDRQVRACYDVTYKTNSVGARDEEFKHFKSKKNVVLLGDSFAEGFGVDVKDTAANKMENLSDLNVLNFGSAYDFGPVQYYLLYKELASKFKHEYLMIFFLPSNDFYDNNPKTMNKTNYKGRYRPYYTLDKSNNYSIIYPEKATKTNNILNRDFVTERSFKRNPPSLKTEIKRFFRKNIYSFRLLNSLRYLSGSMFSNQYEDLQMGWINHDDQEVNASIHFINKIIEIANRNDVKKIYLFAIPTNYEIAFAKKNKIDLLNQKWIAKFNDLQENNSNFIFINGYNFLPKTTFEINQLFLSCDGHWSEEGNAWAAEIMTNHINKN